MITPVIHRKWAREFLARAEDAKHPLHKRRYLSLAVSNTVCARRLEAEEELPEKRVESAANKPTPEN